MEKGEINSSEVITKRVMIICLLILLSSAFLDKAEAGYNYDSFNQQVISYIRNLGNMPGRECEDEIHRSVTPNNIEQSFNSARRNNRCRSVQIYLGIIENGGTDQNRRQARFEIIDAYRRAGDVIGAMNAATDYLKQYGGDASVRIAILRIAAENFVRAKGRDPFWEKMVLGEHEQQTASNPLFQYFVVSRYLADYPQTPYRDEVLEIQDNARQIIEDHYMEIVTYYMRRREYRAVIQRLQPIWAQGTEATLYPEALYTGIDAFIRFAGQVQQVQLRGRVPWRIGDHRVVDERRIISLLRLNPASTPDYDKEIEFLLEQASLLMSYMEQAIPNSSWTSKARDLFQ